MDADAELGLDKLFFCELKSTRTEHIDPILYVNVEAELATVICFCKSVSKDGAGAGAGRDNYSSNRTRPRSDKTLSLHMLYLTQSV